MAKKQSSEGSNDSQLRTPQESKYIEVLVHGEMASKSNSRQIVMRGRYPRLIKSTKAINYSKSALLELIPQVKDFEMIEGYVSLEFHVWYASKRPDLDIALLQDVLQEAGLFKNDRQVVEIHAFKYWDKENPRALVRIREVYI